jgi:hypothetical protein
MGASEGEESLHARADGALGSARRRTFHGELTIRLRKVYGGGGIMEWMAEQRYLRVHTYIPMSEGGGNEGK